MTLFLALLVFFVNTSSGNDEILGCDPKCQVDPRIGCTLDYEGIDCPRSELYNVDNGLWPGKPEFIKITKSSLATHKSDPQAFNVTWAPPNDGSVKLLKGFEVQFHPTSSILLGMRGCYVFNVTHSSSTVHLLATSNFTISCRLTSSFGRITLYTQIYTLPKPPSEGKDKYTYNITDFKARRHWPPKKTNRCDKDPQINPNFDEVSRLLTVTLDDALPASTYQVRLIRGMDPTDSSSDSMQVIHVPAVKVNLVQCDNRWSTGGENLWCIPAKAKVITPAPAEAEATGPGGLSSSMIAVFSLIVIMVIILGATFSLYIYRDRFPNSVTKVLKKICCKNGPDCQRRHLSYRHQMNNESSSTVYSGMGGERTDTELFDIEMKDDEPTTAVLGEIDVSGEPQRSPVIPALICVFYACPHPDMVEMKKCIQAFLKLLCSIVGDQSQVYDYLDHDQANKHANPEAWFEYIINGGKQRQFLVLYTDVLTRLLRADRKNLYYPALQDYREGREFSPFLRKFVRVPRKITHCVTFGFHDNEDQPALEINPREIFHQLTSIDNGRRVFNWKEFEKLLGALKINLPMEEQRPDIEEFMESVNQMAKVMEEDPDWFTNLTKEAKDIPPPSTTSGSHRSIPDNMEGELTPEGSRTSGYYGTATASQESTQHGNHLPNEQMSVIIHHQGPDHPPGQLSLPALGCPHRPALQNDPQNWASYAPSLWCLAPQYGQTTPHAADGKLPSMRHAHYGPLELGQAFPQCNMSHHRVDRLREHPCPVHSFARPHQVNLEAGQFLSHHVRPTQMTNVPRGPERPEMISSDPEDGQISDSYQSASLQAHDGSHSDEDNEVVKMIWHLPQSSSDDNDSSYA